MQIAFYVLAALTLLNSFYTARCMYTRNGLRISFALSLTLLLSMALIADMLEERH